MGGYLELLRKSIEPQGEYYYFSVAGDFCKLNKERSIALIQSYPSENRNCYTNGTWIAMKKGYGHTPVYKDVERQPKHTKMLRLLRHGTDSPSGVNIFIGAKYEQYCTVMDNDSYFNEMAQDVDFLKSQSEYLMLIDGATIVNDNPTRIDTVFGVADIAALSTGLKTLLNILYIKEHNANQFAMVNIDECGDNMLPYIFQEVKDTNIALFLNHAIFELPAEYQIYANNKQVTSAGELLQALRKGGAQTWNL